MSNTIIEESIQIDAEGEILNSGLPQEIIQYLLKTSVAVNRLSTPFDEQEFINMMAEKESREIVQIAYAYEAPGFSRAWEYANPLWIDLDGGWDELWDPTVPGVYGVVEHPNNTVSLLMFVRQQVIRASNGRTRIDDGNIHLNAIFSQYRRLVQGLIANGRPDPQMLAMVGILPGIAIKRKRDLSEYTDIVDMQSDKNINTWRFIKSAVQWFLDTNSMTNEQLIILGSGGTLGGAVAGYFPWARLIDINNQDDLPQSGRHVIIDCTTWWSMGSYLPKLNPNVSWTWINEAYPPPSIKPSLMAQKMGIQVFHIEWVAWKIIPAFPEWYGNNPPCCIWLLDQAASTVKVTVWPPTSV